MTETPTDERITSPGVHHITAARYHADPVAGGSLSSTGARLLTPPSCPALYQQWATEGEAPKRVFDLGHAAHADVLGIGAPLVVIDADDYRSKAARAERDAAYAEGATPLLRAEHEQVQGMAAGLRSHPVAGNLLRPGQGEPELTLAWVDDETGVWCRAMLDWTTRTTAGQLLTVDYKTAKSAAPGAIARAVADYGYHQQDAWYLDGVTAVGLADHPVFVFVFQEKNPPYLITICQLDPETRDRGRVLNHKARDTYRRCTDTGQWPGYTDDVISVSLPPWAAARHQAAWDRGDFDTTGDTE